MSNRKGKAISDEGLNKASGGVVGNPGFFEKYKVYDNKSGAELNQFWNKSEALKYDREHNRTNGEILDEDSFKFAQYQDKWNKQRNN